MGLKELAKKTASERWYEDLSKLGKDNARMYERELDEFLESVDETLQGLFDFFIESKDMSLNDHIIAYEESLTERGYTGGKQASFVKAIKRFFKVNGKTLVLNIPRKTGDNAARPAKPEEIEAVLKFCVTNPREAAMIAIAKDTALRNSDIVRLQFKNIQPLIDNPEKDFIAFKVNIWKTRAKKRKAIVCMGPESIGYLRAWVSKMVELGLPCEPEDYVFVTTRDVYEYKTKNQDRKATVKGSRMGDAHAGVAIIKLFNRAGIPDLSCNSLRKFNTSKLSLDGMREPLVKLMQGKHQNSSLDYYLDAEADEMLEVYREHYHSISVDGQAELARKAKESEDRISELENELEKLRSGEALDEKIQRAVELAMQNNRRAQWEELKNPSS